MTAINKTVPTTKRTLSVQLEDDALEKRIHMIPAAISRYWNALPLKFDITDATCGRNIYDIVFDPQITLSRDGKSARGTHFTVEIVNVPPQPGQPLGPEIRDGSGILQGQSYVQGKVLSSISEREEPQQTVRRRGCLTLKQTSWKPMNMGICWA